MAATFGQVVKYRSKFGGREYPAIVVKVNTSSVDLNAFTPGGAEGERADTMYHAGVTEGTGAGQYSTLA